MSELKAIMAVSADGFVARGPDDDMSWTGKTDKQAFKLLTCVGGIIGAGRTTYELMKGLELPGRELRCITRTPDRSLFPRELTLGQFCANYSHMNAWLIGGQTVLLEALEIGMVDQVFLCHSETELGDGVRDEITPLLRETWPAPTLCRVEDLKVRVYERP